MKEFFAKEFYHNTVGDWAIALAIIVGTLIAAKALYWVIGRIVKKLTAKTKTKLDDIMVDMLEEPIVLIVTIIGVWFAIGRLSFPEKIMNWIDNIYMVMIALTITWLLARLVDAIIKEYVVPITKKTKGDLDDQIIPIIRKAIRAAIWIMGIIIAMNNAGYNVGALLAGLGIGGIALAMAAKDTVANFFGGITIFTDKPFKINDRVKINGFDGTITEIGIRSTRLKTLENRIVTIPNSKFTDGMVENVSSEPHRKVVLKLGLVYETTANKIQNGMKALQTIVDENEDLEENSVISFNEFGDFSLGILFIYYIRKGADIMGVQTNVNMEIKRRFEEFDIEMAFPTQTVYTIAENPQ
ncbi:MAG: mechanosensitive ion channel family protein [Bacteroidales bacterium]|nr:mechanosensitive ion channel family protein [Bacteroidales bacterium]